jgi:uncharacterized protein with HEPN domain
VFGRESLRDLVRNLHEENLRYQEKSEERYRRLQEETREFNREILLRNEKVYTSVIAQMERLGEEIEEGRKQIRANTEAVLRLLDRFDNPGGAAA